MSTGSGGVTFGLFKYMNLLWDECLQAKEQYIEAIHKNVNFEYDLSEVKKIEERFMDVHEYNIRAYNEKQLHDI
jgi:hypothetical protein